MNVKPIKVFICEDDEAIVEIVRTVLLEKGYDVEFSTNGKTAVQRIKKVKPDMLLVDLWLPVYSGAEIIRRVRSQPEFHDIPVILFSASREVERISTELGVNDFLTKPFDIYELENKISLLTKKITQAN